MATGSSRMLRSQRSTNSLTSLMMTIHASRLELVSMPSTAVRLMDRFTVTQRMVTKRTSISVVLAHAMSLQEVSSALRNRRTLAAMLMMAIETSDLGHSNTVTML